MDTQEIIEMGREAVLTSLTFAAPMLIVALVVGIVAGILQSMTQVQDQSVSFVPKIIIAGLTFVFCLPWMCEKLTDYGTAMFEKPVFMAPHGLDQDTGSLADPKFESLFDSTTVLTQSSINE